MNAIEAMPKGGKVDISTKMDNNIVKILITDNGPGMCKETLKHLFEPFYTTKERIQPPKEQKNNLKKDFKDLISNKPWLVLLVIGLLFNVYNSIKQGIVIIYFTHYLNNTFQVRN